MPENNRQNVLTMYVDDNSTSLDQSATDGLLYSSRYKLVNGSLYFGAVSHSKVGFSDTGDYRCRASVPGLGSLLSRKASLEATRESQIHEILALGLIWANLKHVVARFSKF